MMYPRLFLARNLLKHDEVLFVSINDYKVKTCVQYWMRFLERRTS